MSILWTVVRWDNTSFVSSARTIYSFKFENFKRSSLQSGKETTEAPQNVHYPEILKRRYHFTTHVPIGSGQKRVACWNEPFKLPVPAFQHVRRKAIRPPRTRHSRSAPFILTASQTASEVLSWKWFLTSGILSPAREPSRRRLRHSFVKNNCVQSDYDEKGCVLLFKIGTSS